MSATLGNSDYHKQIGRWVQKLAYQCDPNVGITYDSTKRIDDIPVNRSTTHIQGVSRVNSFLMNLFCHDKRLTINTFGPPGYQVECIGTATSTTKIVNITTHVEFVFSDPDTLADRKITQIHATEHWEELDPHPHPQLSHRFAHGG
ncbi:MAG: hypothetical protein S4CHLAM37_01130 [Chlamydiia bacterium]|nr:hypothetical protein [Chlamydiia bacterium]